MNLAGMNPAQLFRYGEALGYRWAKSHPLGRCIRLYQVHPPVPAAPAYRATAALQPERLRDGFTLGAQRIVLRSLSLRTSKARTL